MSNNLSPITVSQLLEGMFFIPSYQRGYRWTEQQITDLLDDIDSFTPKEIAGSDEKTFYCLQPIVLKQCDEKTKSKNFLTDTWYEVIDGQQRLTTILLIIHYANEMWVGKQKTAEFSVAYETREASANFLKALEVKENGTVEINKSNIDFYHISRAYQAIHNWVTGYWERNERDFDYNNFQSKLKSHTKVIWYEVDERADSVELFTRLNVGKIPLTNAELIKALFLSSNSFRNERPEDTTRIKLEIAQMWDEMEQKLNDKDFWAFTTNFKQDAFPTKIELLLDMIASKQKNEIDPLVTFLFFLRKSKEREVSLKNLWFQIERYYLTLCEWYKDKNLYHKTGYLISTGEKIQELIELSIECKKTEFERKLDELITASINFDFETLSYETNGNRGKMEDVLLLFNVESIRSNDNVFEFYPFKFHKSTSWSLEHIHAQNSESFDPNKKEPWFKWLGYHQKLIDELLGNEELASDQELVNLLGEIKASNNDKLTWEKFVFLSNAVIQKFSEKSDDKLNGLHSISNMALLSQPDNSALSNSVFEVKRREIIQMDKEGKYIPICTKRAFLKYYNDKPSSQQYYFWGKEDRENYLAEIRRVLQHYLLTGNENLN